MRSSRSHLIVPIRDRRQHRRILTLKNFGWATGVVIAAFVGITVESNMRHSKNGELGFGSLYGRQLPESTAVKAPEIINEASVPDAAAADPFLVGASAREQLLRADSNVQTDTAKTDTAPIAAPVVQASVASVAGDAHVAIVGDSAGVKIVKDAAKPPVLGGGFGRE